MRALLLALGTLALSINSLGCETDNTIKMDRVGTPNGGSLFAPTSVEVGGVPIILAAGEFGVYQFQGDRFTRVDSQLLPSFRVPNMDHLRDTSHSLSMPRSMLFTGLDSQLWFVDSVSRPWMSQDGGRTFNFIEVPSFLPEESVIQPVEPYRLVAGEKLHLLHPKHIWTLDDPADIASWSAIDLNAVLLDENDNELPPAIRSFVPANSLRDFDLLTVLSNQLLIYRREADQEWVLTSTFPVGERQLVGFEQRNSSEGIGTTLFLATDDAVFRSDDNAETWLRFWPFEDKEIEVVYPILEGQRQVVLVGTKDGEILRHNGAEWTEVWSQDGFTITGFHFDGESLWGTALGGGALRSKDLGESWQSANQGLRAMRTHAFIVEGDELIVATNSGVFRRATGTDWERVHPTPATSLLKIPERGLLVGTSDGQIFIPNQESIEIQSQKAPEFLPESLRRLAPGPQAVVQFARGDTKIYAWSRANGAMVSNDLGATWEPFIIPEALINTLKGSHLTHIFQIGDEVYLVERSHHPGTPVQLWSSREGGGAWAALRSFPPTPSPVILQMGLNQSLYAAYDDVLEFSENGESWTPIRGPWKNGLIFGLHVNKKRAAILSDNHGAVSLHVRENIEEPNTRTFTISIDGGFTVASVEDLVLSGSTLYMLTPRGLFKGELPSGNTDYEERYPTLLAVIGTFIALWASFALLRKFG